MDEGHVVARHACGLALISGRYRHRAAIGIDQELARVKAQPVPRCKGAGHPIAVQLAGFDIRNEGMPVVIGAVSFGIKRYDTGSCRVVSMVEEEQLDAGAVPRKNAEIHPTVADGCAERGCVPVVCSSACSMPALSETVVIGVLLRY